MTVGIARDQQRAVLAHRHVQEVAEQEPAFQKKYGTICHKAGILVHNAGLAAALHFIATRHEGQRKLLEHLAEQLSEVDLVKKAKVDALLRATREASPSTSRALTREVQRCVLWYRRFAKTILNVDAADEDDGDRGEEA